MEAEGNLKTEGRRREKNDPSYGYVERICELYGDVYDDREEDSCPGGADWKPGKEADHLSLEAFRRKLDREYDIKMSTGKIRKILITGGRWTTRRSREVYEAYQRHHDIGKVAAELGVTTSLVAMYLPYEKVVYDLEEKSGNAKRIERWRGKMVVRKM